MTTDDPEKVASFLERSGASSEREARRMAENELEATGRAVEEGVNRWKMRMTGDGGGGFGGGSGSDDFGGGGGLGF